MINIPNLDIQKIIEKSDLDQLFNLNIKNEEWIWVNRDIFLDIASNTLEYDSIDEEDLIQKVNSIPEDTITKILNNKFKEAGWVSINQRLFEKLVDDFESTKDIETYIYASKRFYSKKIIRITNELSWIFKAMAVDTYQHLGLENKTLIEIFEEYFNENGMIMEEILLTGKYKFNVAVWEFDSKTNLLEFYKMDERYRQWSEGNSNFVFNELNK